MVHLPRIDQVPALAPTEIQTIPFAAVEREPGDGQCLALGAGFLQPIVDATRDVLAVADLRDDALKSSLAGVLVHLAAIDLEALAELDIGFGDDFLEQGLTLEQRQLPKIVASAMDRHDYSK